MAERSRKAARAAAERQNKKARAFRDDTGRVHLFVHHDRAFRAVSAGLQLGLAELYHLDTRALDLTAASHLLLQHGPSLAEAWMSGQQEPFEAARGGVSKVNV